MVLILLQLHLSVGIRFSTKLYRQIIDILMALVANLVCFCYESQFIISLSSYKDA